MDTTLNMRYSIPLRSSQQCLQATYKLDIIKDDAFTCFNYCSQAVV